MVKRILPKTKEEVVTQLLKLNIFNYSINDDLSVDIDGSVMLSDRKLDYIPVNFNKVTNNFICRYSHLTSLEGFPKKAQLIDCSYNQISSLQGLINAEIDTLLSSNNLLENFDHCPAKVTQLICGDNQITSLKGLPKNIEFLDLNSNKISSLDYLPMSINRLDISNNKITDLKEISGRTFSYLNITANKIKTIKDSNIKITGSIFFDLNQITLEEQIELCNNIYADQWDMLPSRLSVTTKKEIITEMQKRHSLLGSL